MLLLGLSAAYEVNYSSSSESGAYVFEITQLKYEPYPVNPGEYFDLWIKAQWKGTANPRDATFELLPKFPFSLDSNENPVKSFGVVNNEPLVMRYKVRVDKDAVEGDNELELRYNSDGRDSYWAVKKFDISVNDAQTDFDLVVQESTDGEVSIAVANVGKNTANSLIVRVPQQEDFRAAGTNGQMVGNLEAGDYTLVSFSLFSVSKEAEKTLKIQMDYTDSIGERRSVVKDIPFSADSSSGLNISRGNFSGRNFSTTQSSVFGSVWIWVVIVIVVLGGGYYFFRRFEGVRGVFFNLFGGKHFGKTPEWIVSERTKKK